MINTNQEEWFKLCDTPRVSTAYILLGGVHLDTLAAHTPRRSGSVWIRAGLRLFLTRAKKASTQVDSTMATQNTRAQMVQLFSRQITDKCLQLIYCFVNVYICELCCHFRTYFHLRKLLFKWQRLSWLTGKLVLTWLSFASTTLASLCALDTSCFARTFANPLTSVLTVTSYLLKCTQSQDRPSYVHAAMNLPPVPLHLLQRTQSRSKPWWSWLEVHARGQGTTARARKKDIARNVFAEIKFQRGHITSFTFEPLPRNARFRATAPLSYTTSQVGLKSPLYMAPSYTSLLALCTVNFVTWQSDHAHFNYWALKSF